MQVSIATKNKDTVTLDIPPKGNVSSFFVFSLYKAGSVLQDKVIEDVCRELQIPTISIPKSAFKQGVDETSLSIDAVEDIFNRPGYCFYGFRHFPRYLDPAMVNQHKKLLLIRDPRDMLVSHYFSMKKSHPIPSGSVGDKLLEQRQRLQTIDIDSYVLEKAPSFLNFFKGYQKIDDANLTTFRYEDIVFEKDRWIREILAFLDLSLEDAVIDKIAEKHNIFPTQENVASHIRKVSPGDHREKLQAETIRRLDEIFLKVLKNYHYL